jgi:hypothetical protein
VADTRKIDHVEAAPGELAALIQRALAQLNDFDAEAEDSLAHIRSMLSRHDATAHEIMAHIEKCLERYDYEAARNALVALANHLATG